MILLCSFSKPPQKDGNYIPKYKPEFIGESEDPEVREFLDEYRRLSKNKGIEYKNIVSIGFSSINKANVVGTCSYGDGWREITLDIDFWKTESLIRKKTIFFHEAAHCYCTRGHDFAYGKLYPDNSLKYVIHKIILKTSFSYVKPDGYFEDSCPLSVMHPILVEEKCFKDHYEHYIEEMFDRCNPF